MRPDFDTAVIEAKKLIDYLLNADHPEGGAKAIFFKGCGFDQGAPLALAGAGSRCTAHFCGVQFWGKVDRRWGDHRRRRS